MFASLLQHLRVDVYTKTEGVSPGLPAGWRAHRRWTLRTPWGFVVVDLVRYTRRAEP